MIDSDQLHSLIKTPDIAVLDKFLETRKELLRVDVDELNHDSSSFVYLLDDDHKRHLIVKYHDFDFLIQILILYFKNRPDQQNHFALTTTKPQC